MKKEEEIKQKVIDWLVKSDDELSDMITESFVSYDPSLPENEGSFNNLLDDLNVLNNIREARGFKRINLTDRYKEIKECFNIEFEEEKGEES